MLKIKKTNASQHLFVKFAITVVIVSACAWPTFGERSYQGRSRGFGRQSGGNGLWQHHQSPSENNQLEYGSLQREDEDSGAIQQVNRDEEDFLNWIAPEPEAPEAVTPKGTFIGRKKTVNGKVVYAFTGVPYAKPPTGNLRFKRPEPSEPLSEPLDTTHLPNACPQTVTDIFNDFPGEKVWLPNTNMSEDCLFLNIWVPETVFNRKETELVPVFFWIFGGGYFSGSNSLDVYNGAELAATQGIVVVNVQYRLGPLGFLYLEPGQGNFGLLDQTMALQWTSQNIEYFGGDPNIITAAGESCGAASVGHLMVSPLSKKYIKRAILSSGLLNQKYALKCVDDLKANSMKLAKYAGCEQKAVPEILECLRKVDSEKLNKLQWKLFKNMLEFPFSPIVDGYFLPEHPDILIKKGKAKRADLIMGTVGDEGTYFILYHYLNYFSHLKPTSVTYDRFVDIMNEIFYDYTEAEREAIIDQYTNWENPEDGYVNQQKIGEALGDAIFVCPHRKFADLWSNRGLGVYYYHLTERFTDNPWGKWMGVMHGDDIPLFFGVSASPTEATANETALINNFMEMVGNFVRDGVPSAKWERYTSEHPMYLDVNATTVSSVSTPNLHGPKAKSCAFWNKILPLISSGEESQNNPSQHQHFQYSSSVPNHSPVQSCQRAQQSIQGHKKDNCFIAPSPAQEPIITTSTSCRCSVQEGSTTSENHGFMTPPPAIY